MAWVGGGNVPCRNEIGIGKDCIIAGERRFVGRIFSRALRRVVGDESPHNDIDSGGQMRSPDIWNLDQRPDGDMYQRCDQEAGGQTKPWRLHANC